MKKGFKNFGIFLMVYAIFISGITLYIRSEDSKENKQPDISKLKSISQVVFDVHDKGYFVVGSCLDIEFKKDEIIELGKKFNNTNFVEDFKTIHEKDHIRYLMLVDKDVIFFPCKAIFQSIRGIAITRNNAELKSSYKCTGYDGAARYEQIEPGVFSYEDGL